MEEQPTLGPYGPFRPLRAGRLTGAHRSVRDRPVHRGDNIRYAAIRSLGSDRVVRLIAASPVYWRTLARALPPLLTVDVVAAAVLLPLAAQALRLQASLPLGAGSDFNALVTNAEHLFLVALAGLLASTRRPGWRLLGIGVTTTNAYLGIFSLLRHQPSG